MALVAPAPGVRFAPSVKTEDGRSLTEDAALEASGEYQIEAVTQLMMRSCLVRRLEPSCAAGLINLAVLSRVCPGLEKKKKKRPSRAREDPLRPRP